MRKLLAAILCLLPGVAWAACPATSVVVKDANGTSQTLCYNGSAGQLAPQITIMDSAGTNIAGVTAGNALKVDATATTQGISAASLPLPTGAATSAKQPALGTAGASSADVITVQGIASGTNIPVNVAQVAGNTAANGQFVSIGPIGSGTAVDQNTGAPSAGTQRVLTASASSSFVQPTASDNHANIKNGAGVVYGIVATNNSATINYLRLYNAATGFNACNSSTNLVTQVAIPASTSGAGIATTFPAPIAFSTGISICVTSGYATNDTTNATASAMSVTVVFN